MELGGEVLFRNCRKAITRSPITGLAPAIKADLTERIVLQDEQISLCMPPPLYFAIEAYSCAGSRAPVNRPSHFICSAMDSGTAVMTSS